jgi:small subunit ribosomal protein S6
MTLPAPTYDLVLLLDTQVDDGVRAKIVTDTRAAIEAGGELLRYDAWGERPLTYPIERKSSAEYHLFQFHAGTPELLDGLNRTLRITDGILRFRIIRLKPGVPDAPDMGSAGAVRQGEPEHSEAALQSAPGPAPDATAPAEPAPDAAAPADAPPAETAPAETPPAEAVEATVGDPA